MVSCQFCESQFSTKSSLKTHQTTAKYCLLLQGNGSGSRFKCDYCNKSYASKFKLVYHHSHHCTPKRLADKDALLTDKDALLTDKDALIEELQAQNQVLKEENSNLLAMVKIALTRSNIIDEKNVQE